MKTEAVVTHGPARAPGAADIQKLPRGAGIDPPWSLQKERGLMDTLISDFWLSEVFQAPRPWCCCGCHGTLGQRGPTRAAGAGLAATPLPQHGRKVQELEGARHMAGRGPARAGLMTHPCGFGQAAGLSHSRRDKRLPSKNPPAGALWAAWVRHVCGVRPTEVGRGLRGPIPAPETCSLGGEVPWPVVHTRD